LGYSIEIGNKQFNSKKDALNYFKRILNSYEIGEELTGNDLNDVLSLLKTHPRVKEMTGVGVKTIQVSKLKKFKGKAFNLIRVDGTTEFFSYTKRINSPKTDFSKFREACRGAIQSDLTKVKQDHFIKYAKEGRVKCQETNELVKYEELSIDHRQPNTFSIIVDRFVELNGLDLGKVEYVLVDGAPHKLADENIEKSFKEYHKLKANLRLVKKSLNLGRSYQAKNSRQKKDLKIE
jgi:hypothetical protein